MNRMFVVVATLAVLAAVPRAVAQAPAPNAGSGTPAPATVPAQPGTPPATSSPSTADADARLCLEFPTNRQIILCAEKYLPRKRRA